MIKYIKTAFLNRWNMLLFFGGLGFGVLSGYPEVIFPVVLAAETAYLGLLGTHPKFQAYVEAQQHKSDRAERSQRNKEVMERIIRSIPQPLYQRFEKLRFRCIELKQIAWDLKEPATETLGHNWDALQTTGLDRLLWVFLRLLFTQYSLERFLETTSREELQDDKRRVEKQIQDFDPQDHSPHTEKIRRALQDNLATIEERIRNVDRAEGNYQYVKLEIDRLENKIISLAELAVNRQDPDYVSSQIDAVASSVKDTESTMKDLQFITGLGPVDDEVPELLQNAPVYIAE